MATKATKSTKVTKSAAAWVPPGVEQLYPQPVRVVAREATVLGEQATKARMQFGVAAYNAGMRFEMLLLVPGFNGKQATRYVETSRPDVIEAMESDIYACYAPDAEKLGRIPATDAEAIAALSPEDRLRRADYNSRCKSQFGKLRTALGEAQYRAMMAAVMPAAEATTPELVKRRDAQLAEAVAFFASMTGAKRAPRAGGKSADKSTTLADLRKAIAAARTCAENLVDGEVGSKADIVEALDEIVADLLPKLPKVGKTK